MSVRIFSDSACDLSMEEANALGLQLIPLKIRFGEEEFLDSVNMNHDQFFEKLIETDVMPITSQIPPYEFEQIFKQATANGDQIVCLILSSKLSGCYQSACIAAQDFQDQVYVVDTENACIGQRLLAEYAIRLANEGKTATEIVDLLNSKKKNIHLIALLDTLEYLKRGGRISPVVAAACNLLSIKPVIALQNGEVTLLGKARGSRQGNNKLTEFIEKAGEIDLDMPYCLAYSGLSDHLLRKYIEDHKVLYADKVDHLPISTIGCAIGTHIGPGAIGFAFFSK